ncbi:3-deoxy-7-phosphoheptulonate synthase, partial [Streptomyces sp. FH025]|uniref:3-deoxy-7-phosphoheptulonate synthase n=1 Tax=Streptomyces sp. FH025 TaxID=2815937 RepID=UPI001A9FF372
LPWIGARTAGVDDAHVRFLTGVANPVGVKVGPGLTADGLLAICERLDPDRRAGRLVLISRMGAGQVAKRLPGLVAAVLRAGHPVVWLCDPMHGNTVQGPRGLKTRHVAAIEAEVTGFHRVLTEAGIRPGGLHLEATAGDVTECVGGRADGRVAEGDVPLRYTTACDPRLNRRQAHDVVRLFADLMTTD